MNLLRDAYTALLSGLTYQTGNEIHWEDERGKSITIEVLDAETECCIIRGYWGNGNLIWKHEH